MQIKKDHIYEVVLEIARNEFLEKGFKDTNMRTIAKLAGVGLSNIYNYFRNKDEIFQEVLSPVILALDRIMESHNDEEHLNIDIFTSQEYLKAYTLIFVDLILQYKDELRILFYKSHGSLLENYKEVYIEKHNAQGMEYMKLMKEKYPQLNIEVSDFFMHTMSSWWLSTIGELATHDLNRDELACFVTEFMEFTTAGWKKLMKAD